MLLIRRLTSLYDVTTFTESVMNPNLCGMGHVGWGETGNPTHCILFVWNPTRNQVEMSYKLNEADAVWRPTLKFDSETKLWIAPVNGPTSLCYEVMSPAATSEKLSTAPTIVTQRAYPDSLATSIFKLSETEGEIYGMSLIPNHLNNF